MYSSLCSDKLATSLILAVALAVPAAGAQSRDSAGTAPIVIGQTIALSGNLAEHGRAVRQGALAYIVKVNAHGGIAGRPIILKSLDDEGEALRRSARSLNREALVAALESMHAYDLGGVSVSFSPAAHAGADFVDTDVIASDGRFVR